MVMILGGPECRGELITYADNVPASPFEAYKRLDQKLGDDNDTLTLDRFIIERTRVTTLHGNDEAIVVKQTLESGTVPVYRFIKDTSLFNDRVEYHAEKNDFPLWCPIGLSAKIYRGHDDLTIFIYDLETLFGATVQNECILPYIPRGPY